jgi:hypothetical protein
MNPNRDNVIFADTASPSRRPRSRIIAMACATLAVCSAPLVLVGCPQATPVVAPATDCGAAIIADALAGLTIEQILAKEGERCGADLIAIVETILKSTNPNISATMAYREATNLRARLQLSDGGAK